MTERKPELCIICGRKIGTYTGYHLIDTILRVKGFQPLRGVNLPSGDLVFDFDWGTIRQGDKFEQDLIGSLATCPKATDDELKGCCEEDAKIEKPQPQPETKTTAPEIIHPAEKSNDRTPNTSSTPAPLPKL